MPHETVEIIGMFHLEGKTHLLAGYLTDNQIMELLGGLPAVAF